MVVDQSHRISAALHTPLIDLLGCELPIMNAGMGGVARSELAAAVCNAGGFGCLGMVREPIDRIVDEVTQLRALTDRPFAVNLIPAATDSALLEQQIDACLQLEVPAIALFWDVDRELVQELKKHSVMVLHQVGSYDDAQHALRAGVDILIAQGIEAGGHVRGSVSTFSLVPELVALSPVPVVASGGIANGAGLVAALALGAQGISCGSLFVATTEANAHPLHQQRICEARAEDSVHTYRFYHNWPMAAATRVLSNGVTRGEYDHLRNNREPTEIGEQDGQAVLLFSTDSPLRDATGNISAMALYAGQSCSQIDAIRPVADCIQNLLAQAREALGELQPTHETNDSVPGVAENSQYKHGAALAEKELLSALRELLAAERAGARTAAACLQDVHNSHARAQLRQLHRQEVSSCRALLCCLKHLGAEPGQAVGDFYQKVMALDTFSERMTLIDKGQRWVLHRVERLLAELSDPVLLQQLEIVRRYHA